MLHCHLQEIRYFKTIVMEPTLVIMLIVIKVIIITRKCLFTYAQKRILIISTVSEINGIYVIIQGDQEWEDGTVRT
jgi:hypothetical protein